MRGRSVLTYARRSSASSILFVHDVRSWLGVMSNVSFPVSKNIAHECALLRRSSANASWAGARVRSVLMAVRVALSSSLVSSMRSLTTMYV